MYRQSKMDIKITEKISLNRSSKKKLGYKIYKFSPEIENY